MVKISLRNLTFWCSGRYWVVGNGTGKQRQYFERISSFTAGECLIIKFAKIITATARIGYLLRVTCSFMNRFRLKSLFGLWIETWTITIKLKIKGRSETDFNHVVWAAFALPWGWFWRKTDLLILDDFTMGLFYPARRLLPTFCVNTERNKQYLPHRTLFRYGTPVDDVLIMGSNKVLCNLQ
jgi:hypothetical protein